MAASPTERNSHLKIQMIPLSQLVPYGDNVRKTGVNEGIESFSIKNNSLLVTKVLVTQTISVDSLAWPSRG